MSAIVAGILSAVLIGAVIASAKPSRAKAKARSRSH